MSVVNLLGALLTPSYPTIYLVRSEVMDELDRRSGDPEPYFDGTVGVLEPAEEEMAEEPAQGERPQEGLVEEEPVEEEKQAPLITRWSYLRGSFPPRGLAQLL
jgi:hypothetical protein